METASSALVVNAKVFSVLLFLALLAASAIAAKSACASPHGPPHSGGYTGPGSPHGGYTGPGSPHGGYTGPGPSLVTVTQALSMDDKTWLALKGSITRSLGGKDYMFADSTGEIEVRIGPKEWMGQQISASDTVEIHGHIHKDWKRPNGHVHVKRLIKL